MVIEQKISVYEALYRTIYILYNQNIVETGVNGEHQLNLKISVSCCYQNEKFAVPLLIILNPKDSEFQTCPRVIMLHEGSIYSFLCLMNSLFYK